MRSARDRAIAWGRDAFRAAEAVREVVLAHYPALPLPMVTEAVAWLVPDPEGQPAGTPLWAGDCLMPADDAQLVEALAFALRFDARGKARRAEPEHLAPLAAAQLVQHLHLAGFVVMKRPPAPLQVAGGDG